MTYSQHLRMVNSLFKETKIDISLITHKLQGLGLQLHRASTLLHTTFTYSGSRRVNFLLITTYYGPRQLSHLGLQVTMITMVIITCWVDQSIHEELRTSLDSHMFLWAKHALAQVCHEHRLRGDKSYVTTNCIVLKAYMNVCRIILPHALAHFIRNEGQIICEESCNERACSHATLEGICYPWKNTC